MNQLRRIDGGRRIVVLDPEEFDLFTSVMGLVENRASTCPECRRPVVAASGTGNLCTRCVRAHQEKLSRRWRALPRVTP